MSDVTGYFDLGTRTATGPNTTHHGSGWHDADGTVVLHPDPDLKLVVRPDGSLSVWHDRRRAW